MIWLKNINSSYVGCVKGERDWGQAWLRLLPCSPPYEGKECLHSKMEKIQTYLGRKNL